MSETLGSRLRQARLAAGYTQRQLAAAVQADHTYLSKIERGKCLPPSARLLHRIAAVLGADEEQLLVLADKPPVAVLRRRLAELETEREQMAGEVRAALLQVDLIHRALEHDRRGRVFAELGTLLKLLMQTDQRLREGAPTL